MSIRFPPLYVILDADLLKTSELPFARLMAESGVELLQYRAKHASSRQVYDTCKLLCEGLAESTGKSAKSPRFAVPRLVINDRPDIAALLGAGGVHVGQDDLGVEFARAIVGRGAWVGVSTHNLEQVEAADRTSADYIAFGPMFPTASKANPDPVVGLKLLAQARKLTGKPLVAIGGITLERAAETYHAGADSLAVIRDVIQAADPAERVRAFLQKAEENA